MIKEIAFFAYPSTDMARSRKFYEGVLGLIPDEGSGFDDPDNHWIEYTAGNATIGVGQSPDWPPSRDGASVAFEVDDFEKMIEKVKSAGIVIESGPHHFPSCSMFVIRDPDENKVTIHRRKKK